LVGILILRGILTLLAGVGALNDLNQLDALGSSNLLPGWFRPLVYLLLILGVMSILGAILIALYRRLGLIIGGLAVLIDLLALAFLILNRLASLAPANIVGLVITFAILYYTWKYLTQEPEKSAFS
jgi:hypothetical protein